MIAMADYSICELFLKDRKHANAVADLINNFDEDGPHLVERVRSLEHLFTTVSKRGEFSVNPDLRLTHRKAFDSEITYCKWLQELFQKTFDKLLIVFGRNIDVAGVELLQTLLNLLAVDAKSSTTNVFPSDKLQAILKIILLSNKKNGTPLYEQFIKHQDVYFFTWQILQEFFASPIEDSDLFISNILGFLEKIVDAPASGLLCFTDGKSFRYKEVKVSKFKENVWLNLTNRRMSAVNHRNLLLLFVECYISKLRKPTLFTDFLMGSLSLGGATGVLALQGMSVLVTKHNLECPNIFAKLYNMFNSDILYTRYISRLFHLADLFLQSTYISETLVAAFAKRLSRLSLIAQAPNLILIMQFVGNLLIRHPALTVLVHSTSAQSVESDPFDMCEEDPLKSRALESSLWELAILKNHVQPKVAAAAKFLDNNLPSIEWDIREQLDYSYPQMFESEIKKKAKEEPALTFIRPTSISQLRDDRVYKMWSLT